jgi:hypothetical protein
MKEKPILFSTPMVQAILEGRKTQTRRVIKPQPIKVFKENGVDVLIDDGRTNAGKRPYAVGDILWVRETWAKYDAPYGLLCSKYQYKVDKYDLSIRTSIYGKKIKWKPSIFMPREAARLFLEVKCVRVERLRDISEKDAEAESAKPIGVKDLSNVFNYLDNNTGGDSSELSNSYKAGFYKIWEELNAKRGCSWDSNPWVWVIEFERKEK